MSTEGPIRFKSRLGHSVYLGIMYDQVLLTGETHPVHSGDIATEADLEAAGFIRKPTPEPGEPVCHCRKVPCECPMDVEFGCDPEDSAALEKLRMAIDDNLVWRTDAEREAGDYESAVEYSGELATECIELRAALATLTRERDELRAELNRRCPSCEGVKRCYPDCAFQPATPPAPQPGGHGPTEALRREIVKAARRASHRGYIRDDGQNTLQALAEELEQGSEGRKRTVCPLINGTVYRCTLPAGHDGDCHPVRFRHG